MLKREDFGKTETWHGGQLVEKVDTLTLKLRPIVPVKSEQSKVCVVCKTRLAISTGIKCLECSM